VCVCVCVCACVSTYVWLEDSSLAAFWNLLTVSPMLRCAVNQTCAADYLFCAVYRVKKHPFDAVSYPMTFANVTVLMLMMQLVGAQIESGRRYLWTPPVQSPPRLVESGPMATSRPSRRFPRVFTHGENTCFMWSFAVSVCTRSLALHVYGRRTSTLCTNRRLT